MHGLKTTPEFTRFAIRWVSSQGGPKSSFTPLLIVSMRKTYPTRVYQSHTVAELPDKWRVPLVLAEFEEKSHAEIGEILNCSAKAVEVRICKARQQLRENLASLLAE